MRAPRRPDTLFWVDSERVETGFLTLDREESHHLLRVHRAEVGAPFEATDGAGTLYRCRLADGAASGARGEILERRLEAGELPAAIHLVVGLPDSRAVENVVEHVVPLGASSVVFAACDRSPRGALSAERLARLRRIAIAGVKQSRRTRLPEIGVERSLGEALQGAAAGVPGARLAADPGGARLYLSSGISPQHPVFAVIGPPGGFTDQELASLGAGGFSFISLGLNRLSTETATIALLCEVRKSLLDISLNEI